MPTSPFDWRVELTKTLPVLRAYARSLARNRHDADDLVQETILKAWGHREQFTIGTNLQAWLMTILRNTFYTARRRKTWEVEDVDGEFAATLTVEGNQEWHLSLKELEQALDKLSAEQREVVALVAGAGLSYEEAAEICGCPVGTIKSRLARARSHLSDMLERPPVRPARRPQAEEAWAAASL